MKKSLILFVMLAVCSIFAFSAVTYTYSGTDTIYIGLDLYEQGDTYVSDTFVYDSNFTYVSGYPESVFLSSTAVSTTAAATTTIAVTELADVKISVDHTAGSLTMYFNSTDLVGIPITADTEMIMNTGYFNKILIKNTATTTTYNVVIERVF